MKTNFVPFINTPLQRGVQSPRNFGNRFNGFSRLTHLAILAAFAVGWLTAASAATNDLASTLQRGLFEEEANQNLAAAIQAYQSVVAQFDKDRRLAATAVFRLGECYRKQGNTNDAAAQYERILQEFADQSTLATLSQQNLSVLRPAIPGVRLAQAGKETTAPGASTNEGTPQVSVSLLMEQNEVTRLQNLLKDSPDLINARDNSGRTPLHQAVEKGQITVARFLLDHGAEVNLRDNSGRTPLYRAAASGNKAMVEFLLSRKADPQIADGDGALPLHESVWLGYKSIVELLLAGGTPVDARTRNGATPLQFAARDDRKAVAETLIAAKANVNARSDSQSTPLHWAAQYGHASLVSLLLANGAEVNARDNDGATPLALAVAAGAKQFSLPVIQLLLAAKADPNLDFLARPDSNLPPGRSQSLGRRTLLTQAGLDDRTELQELLLKNGANPNASPSGEEVLPLTQAAFQGRSRAVALLLEYKADPNVSAQQGRTPLHFALPQPPMVEMLLKAGANVNATNWLGETPLHWAVSANLKPAAELLLQHGANVNLADKNGNTPLHWAVLNGRQEMVQLLLDHQANVNLVNIDGQAPLDLVKNVPTGWSTARENVTTGLEVSRLVRSGTPYGMGAMPVPGTMPVMPVYPGTLRLSGQTPPELSENQKAMLDALKQRGAVEDRPRLDQIQVRRSSGKFSTAVFTRGTNDWNRFTLLELIAAQYDLLSSSPNISGGSRQTMNALARDNRALAFPDFSRIRLRRPAADSPGWREQTVDLRPMIEEGDCSKDVPLQWGDVVDIPEADHLLNIEWPGFSPVQVTNLIKCLSRQVEVTVATPGKTGPGTKATRLTLAPRITFSPVGTQIGDIETRAPYWIRSVLRNSGVLLSSSDLTRIKVTRKGVGGGTRDWIVDCSDATPAPDLWLRDGDVIEVPPKR